MGFYEIESETTDEKRMDVVLLYGNERFIIELKIWRGEKRQSSAYQQLLHYMNTRNETHGYLLTFDFRECREILAEWVEIEGKRIYRIQV